ncbi:DUF4062 domain-containing protein [Pseudomonas extremorientalis]|uniref:DUF4062 domain-containing protein n=2 Tax=Pseudomonas extremorientalis TaxID=169669 RepID=A0A1H0P8A4_9PSED|nr:DUF4062 domain-containing protein [Pseudomonas extremorientalis]OIN07850.1 hypothetical protein BFN10_16285 [Pseudomonas extremorientalis]SDP01292.1 protein of unknown function [Pseudomonas extremorientalis]
MQKRHQVFISSTYADLKQERALVTQTLMQMDCIPAGMELFPATDEDQLEFIKKVIDDCDYYLLIIGGRYGSTTEEGISYTEKEYEYAVEKAIPVIALLHQNPTSISVDKSDISPEMRERLDRFRGRVSTGRLVKYWSNGTELAGQVAISIAQAISRFPTVGWIRGNNVASEDLLREINDLRKENQALKEKYELQKTIPPIEELNPADLESGVTLHGTYLSGMTRAAWSVNTSWREIFYLISPYLTVNTSEATIKDHLKSSIITKHGVYQNKNILNDQDFQTVAIQMQILGLVTINARNEHSIEKLWKLTPKGEALMYKLRVIQS